MTLAAFLGDHASIAECENRGIDFPLFADFEADRAYNPNPHDLNLDPGLLRNQHLILCLMTWGKEPILRIANACAQLQCAHNIEPYPAVVSLQAETAAAVQSYINEPTDRRFETVTELAEACRELYSPYEDDHDSEEGSTVWYQLGAPWFAAETICKEWEIRAYDGDPPPEGQSSWIRRNSVWIGRAADAAAEWSTYDRVNDEIRSAALMWALSR